MNTLNNQGTLSNIKSIYSTSQISKKIKLHIIYVNKNLHQTIEDKIKQEIEGKCIVEGFVKPNSIKIITFTSGLIKAEYVLYDVLFKCEICFPVAGMLIGCTAINITKAGIRCESNDNPSPYIIYISRDQYFENDYFNSIKENDKLTIRVIAQRFELNDKYISIIGDLIMPKKNKPLIVF